jgi:cysteine desulfurase
VYLDHAATSPMTERALSTYVAVARKSPGNPASAHAWGAEAKHELELARTKLANLYGLAADEVIFTSGATESLNWVVRAMEGRVGCVVATPIEHGCVIEPLKRLGDRVVWLPVTPAGMVDFEASAELLKVRGSSIAGLIVMGANNETGVIQPVRALSSLVKRLNPDALVVSDLVALGSWGGIAETIEWVDIGVLSPHKVGGPVGVGVVLRRHGVALEPLLVGGPQEYDLRAGTVSVPLVVAGAVALSDASVTCGEHRKSCRALQYRLERGLKALGVGVEIVGADCERVGITSALFPGLRAEDLLFLLDERGVRASAGAACASGAMQPSHVLLAQGYPPQAARSQVRFSYASNLDNSAIDFTVEAVGEAVAKLRSH